MYEAQFPPRDVIDAMQAHNSTLEELHLNFDDDWEKVFWNKLPQYRLVVGILQNFNVLRSFTISQQALLGLLHREPSISFDCQLPLVLPVKPRLIDILRTSIEDLTILYCDRRVDEHLQGLAQRGPVDISKLGTVNLCCAAEGYVQAIGQREWAHSTESIAFDFSYKTVEERLPSAGNLGDIAKGYPY